MQQWGGPSTDVWAPCTEWCVWCYVLGTCLAAGYWRLGEARWTGRGQETGKASGASLPSHLSVSHMCTKYFGLDSVFTVLSHWPFPGKKEITAAFVFQGQWGEVWSRGWRCGLISLIAWVWVQLPHLVNCVFLENSLYLKKKFFFNLYWSIVDKLEEGMAIHSSILAWRITLDRGDWQTSVQGVAKSQTWLSN